MWFFNPLHCNRRVALLERARFCRAIALHLRRVARSLADDPAWADAYHRSARRHYQRARALMAEIRAITPRKSHAKARR